MPYSLQEITDAWGRWKTAQYDTTPWYTESTNYAKQDTLNRSDYLAHETKVTTLSTTFGDNQGQIVTATGDTVWYDNDTNDPQTNTFTYSQTKAETFTWALGETLKVGVSETATIGVPGVASGAVTLNTELDLTSTVSSTKSDSSTWSNSTPVTTPVHKSTKCQTVIQIQKYDVPFTSQVRLRGDVAIWFNKKVDFGNPDNGLHWLWFIPIGEVFGDVNSNNLISTDGYHISGGDVIADATGTLTGDLGLSISVSTEEVWLRGWTPTQADVEQDLLAKLAAVAKNELQEGYSDLGASDSLTGNMRKIAYDQFQRDFGQPFSANYVPKDGQGIVRVADQPCLFYPNGDMDKQISDFVSSYIIPAAGIPEWMQATCEADITTFIKNKLAGNEDNQCHAVNFPRSYPAKSRTETTMAMESILVFANGTLTETSITATLHAVYFAGAFYPTGSPIAAAIGKLEDDAYSSAAALTGVSSIPDDKGLTTALYQYGKTQFNSDFSYEYTGTPVDFPSDETQALLTRNDHLGPFVGRDTSTLDTWVEQHIFSGLKIPVAEVAAAALKDVQEEFRGIFSDTQRGAWNTLKLDKLYPESATSPHPTALNALIVYWAEDTTVVQQVDGKDQQVPVSLTYTYFIGVVHECKPDSVIADLVKKLITAIPDQTKTDSTGGINTLQNDLQNYVIDGWKTAFSFDYNGHGTAPPDMIPKSKNLPFQITFEWNGIPTKEEIQGQIDRKWFKKDATTPFKYGVGEQVYADLVDRISYLSGPETPKIDCEWQQNPFIQEFTFTSLDQAQLTMKEYVLYSFVYGQLSEEGHGVESHAFFVCNLLAFFCMVNDVPDEEDPF